MTLVKYSATGRVRLDRERQMRQKHFMPTLIRLVIFLLFLAGIAYGGMFALATLVEPQEKQVTVRVPARDLFSE